MLQETLLNAEGYKELQDELENLKTVGRKEAAEKIKVARSYGDLSENAEYDEAMSDQAKLEARINELENMLKNAKVFDESSLSKDVIHIGSNVVIVDDKKNEFSYKMRRLIPMQARFLTSLPSARLFWAKRSATTFR